MLIMRSEMTGTRVLAIDQLTRDGARGRNGRPVVFIDDPDQAEVVLHAATVHRSQLFRSFGNLKASSNSTIETVPLSSTSIFLNCSIRSAFSNSLSRSR